MLATARAFDCISSRDSNGRGTMVNIRGMVVFRPFNAPSPRTL